MLTVTKNLLSNCNWPDELLMVRTVSPPSDPEMGFKGGRVVKSAGVLLRESLREHLL